jgi:photosystem II stability/assembly factor-like uncharacterized protein
MPRNLLARFFLIAGCLLMFLPTHVALADEGAWTTTNIASLGPRSLAINPESPGIVYALGAQQVLVSRDGGAAWAVAPESQAGITQLVFDPLTPAIMYAVANGQLLKRASASQSWATVAPGVLQGVTSMTVNPANPNQLWVVAGTGLFRSNDAGATWASGKVPATGQITAFALGRPDPKHLYVWSSGQGFFYSQDDGASWVKTGKGLEGKGDVEILQVDGAMTGALYAQVRGVLLASSDHGANWAPITPADRNYRSRVLLWTTADGGTLYTTNGAILYRSRDRGASWQALQPPNFRNVEELFVDPKNPAVLYALADGAVLKSFDAGANWTPPPKSSPQIIAAHPADPAILFANGEGRTFAAGALRSGDGGETWARMTGWPENLAWSVRYFTPGNPNRILAGAGNTLLVSADSGQSWQSTGMPTTGAPRAIATQPGNDAVIMVSLGQVILRSDNGGAAWASSQLPNNVAVNALWIASDNARRVLAATNAGIYRSDDSGATWLAVTELPQSGWYQLWAGGQAGHVYANGDRGIAFSDDGGQRWSVQSISLSPDRYLQVWPDWRDPGVLYALFQNRAYVSPNRGQHWAPLGLALPRQARTLAVDGATPRHLYVSDDALNLWRFTLPAIPPTPTATPTLTPTATRTPLPTPTATPTATNTPTPRPQAKVIVLTPPTPLPVSTQSGPTGEGPGLMTILLGGGFIVVLGAGVFLLFRRRSAVTPVAPPSTTTHAASVFCPHCGQPNASGGRFCMSCGKPLTS